MRLLTTATSAAHGVTGIGSKTRPNQQITVVTDASAGIGRAVATALAEPWALLSPCAERHVA